MRVASKVLAILLVSFGIGYATMHALIAHAVARGTPEYAVRLGGAMAGLFSGGAAAVVLGIALFLQRGPADKG